MDALERLSLQLRLARALQVTYAGSVGPERLAVAIASRLEGDPEVVVLEGEQVTAEEGESISSALLGGRTVVVADAGATELSVRLVDTWADFCDSPQHTSSSAGRHIQFSPIPREVDPGRLVLVSTEGRSVGYKADRVWLQAGDVSRLLANRSKRDRPRRARRVGRPKPARSHVLRDLCLMHGRDPLGTVRRDLGTALNADDAFTWTDLQTLLRRQTNSAAPLIAHLRETNRLGPDLVQALDDGLLDVASDARIPPADQGRVYSSIWELMWMQQLGGDHVFRGQWSALWPLTPTLFRAGPDGHTLTIETLVERLEVTRRFIDVLRANQGDFFAKPPSEDELLAVAQHYGFPTPLLDYTSSLSVAALFATMPARGLEEASAVGVIYYLNTDRAELKLDPGRTEDLPRFSVLDAADIRIGLFDFIRPALSASDDRIGRQSALFLSGFDQRDLSSVSIDVMLFEQRPSDVYEDPVTAVTEADILPPDSSLQRLAEEVRTDRSHAAMGALPDRLAQARLPGAGLPGSTGANLFRQVRAANEFFPQLSAALDDERRPQVGEILSDYFRLAHARAVVGDELAALGHSAAGDSSDSTSANDGALTPLAIALQELAELFDVDLRRLQRQVDEALGPLDDRYFRGGPPDHEPDEAMALAVGLYLASWEKLQRVRGEEASNLALTARMALPADDAS